MVKDLEKLLREEIRLENEFLAICNTKTKSLVDLNFGEIDILTRKEQYVLSALAQTIRARLQLLEEEARKLNTSELSVTTFASRLQDPIKSQLLELCKTLRSTMTEVNKVLTRNKALTETYLTTSTDFFDTICSSVSDNVAYSRYGIDPRKSAPKLIIDQVI